MYWKIKATAFRALDVVPGGAAAHYLLQRHVTRTWPRRAVTLDSLWGIAKRVITDYERIAGRKPTSVLEIGAGRDLAVPLALRMMGVTSVIASDVTRLARLDLVRHAAAHMARKAGIEPPQVASWEDLARFGISYRAPHHVAAPDGPVDCTCSNEVLEHVPTAAMAPLLTGLKAATKPDGVTTHSIDYSDHYARSDKNVSRFNFLTFSDEDWAKYNTGMQHVNRLRHSDYVRMFRDAGFSILEETPVPGEPLKEVSDNLAPQFLRYAPADLFALKGKIVASA
jgi:2-polyprenyl-3-methyl-5-hydroxy-6-metoxy-1,4-benzoquinol methylase